MPSSLLTDMIDGTGSLGEPVERELIHTRRVVSRGYLRADGLWDIEAEIFDTKAYPMTNLDGRHVPVGEPVHGMLVRLTLDDALRVHAAVAAMPGTPFPECPAAAAPVGGLVGSVIGPGWRKAIDSAMGGTAGCTHVRELIAAMATVAFQTIPNYRKHQYRQRGVPEPDADRPGHQFGKCLGWDPNGSVVARVMPQFFGITSKKDESPSR